MPDIISCSYCNESFDRKKLSAHQNKCRKNPYTNIECKYCRKEFNQSEIHSHLIKCKKYHENKSKNNIFIICEHCNEKILRKNLLFHNSLCFKNPKNWKNIEDYNEDKSLEISQKKLFSEKNKLVVKKYTGDNAFQTNADGSVEFLGKQDKSKAKPKKIIFLKILIPITILNQRITQLFLKEIMVNSAQCHYMIIMMKNLMLDEKLKGRSKMIISKSCNSKLLQPNILNDSTPFEEYGNYTKGLIK